MCVGLNALGWVPAATVNGSVIAIGHTPVAGQAPTPGVCTGPTPGFMPVRGAMSLQAALLFVGTVVTRLKPRSIALKWLLVVVWVGHPSEHIPVVLGDILSAAVNCSTPLAQLGCCGFDKRADHGSGWRSGHVVTLG